MVVAVLLISCTTEPSDPSPVVSRDWVTSEVASRLDPDGRFGNLWETAEYAGEIQAGTALEIGTVFARTIGPSLRNSLELDHEGPIDFSRLRSCGHQVYLHSSFERLGDSEVEQLLHASTGGQWLQQFCSASGVPTLIQTVPARTRITVVDGQLVIPQGISASIVPFGIPRSNPWILQGPERAVELVFRATGQRISAVPYPVHDIYAIGMAPPDPARTTGAYWKVVVEQPVAYRHASTGETRTTSQFWVVLGYGALAKEVVYVAAREPPPPIWEHFPAGISEDSVLLVPREPLALVPFVKVP